jgi:hypothetical protein
MILKYLAWLKAKKVIEFSIKHIVSILSLCGITMFCVSGLGPLDINSSKAVAMFFGGVFFLFAGIALLFQLLNRLMDFCEHMQEFHDKVESSKWGGND